MDLRPNNVLKAAKVLILGRAALPSASPEREKPHPLLARFTHAAEGLAKEAEIGPQLHEESMAALHRMLETDSGFKQVIDHAYGYAIFPSAAKAALVLGVTYGKGEVFEKGQVVGYAGIVQITGGVQLGGQTLHIVVIFDDEKALKRFKSGKTSFAANASLGIVKAGLSAMKAPYGLRVYLFPEGGEMIEAAIGGQSIRFRPAVAGRLRDAG